MRSLGVCLVLTLQMEGQSSTASPRPATSPRLRRRSSASSECLSCGETCWRLVTGTKVTGVLYMWCLPCLSYVDSASNLLGLFCVCLVWDVEDPERRWHDSGTCGLHSTTMNVATLPELFMYSLEREREREREGGGGGGQKLIRTYRSHELRFL